MRMAYWEDDDYLITARLLDKNGNAVSETAVGRKPEVSISDFNQEEKFMMASFRIAQPGTYYVYVSIPTDFPYPNGCYYLTGAEWY